MLRLVFLLTIFLGGCVTDPFRSGKFVYKPVKAHDFTIATWQKITDTVSPVHIYIEGDGSAFNGRGMPTADPTPSGTFLRELAVSDNGANVVYIARPCQYITSDSCTQSDWTDGRFSEKVIKSMAEAVKKVAGSKEIILIGYSGGAMVSGLIIQNYPDLNVIKWITIAGVLNHKDWTEYFGDCELSYSLSLNNLPKVLQLHYVAEYDDVIPYELSVKWIGGNDMIVVPDATHGDFGDLCLDFSI